MPDSPPAKRPYRRLYNRTEAVPPEDDSVRMTLRIPTADYDRLRTVATTTRRPMTDIYREALTRHLDDIIPTRSSK